MELIDDRDNNRIILHYRVDGNKRTIVLPYEIHLTDLSFNFKLSAEALNDLVSVFSK